MLKAVHQHRTGIGWTTAICRRTYSRWMVSRFRFRNLYDFHSRLRRAPFRFNRPPFFKKTHVGNAWGCLQCLESSTGLFMIYKLYSRWHMRLACLALATEKSLMWVEFLVWLILVVCRGFFSSHWGFPPFEKYPYGEEVIDLSVLPTVKYYSHNEVGKRK